MKKMWKTMGSLKFNQVNKYIGSISIAKIYFPFVRIYESQYKLNWVSIVFSVHNLGFCHADGVPRNNTNNETAKIEIKFNTFFLITSRSLFKYKNENKK